MLFYRLEEKDLLKIKNILHKNNNEEINVIETFTGAIWFISEKGTELYLKPFYDELIISRVCLINSRQGSMTAILEELKNYCKLNNISQILIQSIMTKEMINFAVKNGFEPINGATFMFHDLLIGDYKLKL